MASGKRASMREGPLSALFRKTEEDGLEPPQEQTPAPPTPTTRMSGLPARSGAGQSAGSAAARPYP